MTKENGRRVLLIADDEGRRTVQEITRVLVNNGHDIDRLPTELAVQRAELPMWEYDVIIIATTSLRTFSPDTRVDQLPSPADWVSRDSSSGGIRALTWIAEACQRAKEPQPRVYMGCYVPIQIRDVDYRQPIRAHGGIPFYIDPNDGTRGRTPDNTLTIRGAIGEILRFLDEFDTDERP